MGEAGFRLQNKLDYVIFMVERAAFFHGVGRPELSACAQIAVLRGVIRQSAIGCAQDRVEKKKSEASSSRHVMP